MFKLPNVDNSLVLEAANGCVVIFGTSVPPIVACVPFISIVLPIEPCKYALLLLHTILSAKPETNFIPLVL